jgi:hypothetical protein
MGRGIQGDGRGEALTGKTTGLASSRAQPLDWWASPDADERGDHARGQVGQALSPDGQGVLSGEVQGRVRARHGGEAQAVAGGDGQHGVLRP